MSMSITELERALKSLRLSGMSETLQARALAVSCHEMDFIEAFSWLVQDELTGVTRACSTGAMRCAVCPRPRI